MSCSKCDKVYKAGNSDDRYIRQHMDQHNDVPELTDSSDDEEEDLEDGNDECLEQDDDDFNDIEQLFEGGF